MWNATLADITASLCDQQSQEEYGETSDEVEYHYDAVTMEQVGIALADLPPLIVDKGGNGKGYEANLLLPEFDEVL